MKITIAEAKHDILHLEEAVIYEQEKCEEYIRESKAHILELRTRIKYLQNIISGHTSSEEGKLSHV